LRKDNLITLTKVHIVNTLSQFSAVQLFSILNVIWQPGTLHPDVLVDAAVTGDPVVGVVAFPDNVGFHVALVDDALDDRERFVIVRPITSR